MEYSVGGGNLTSYFIISFVRDWCRLFYCSPPHQIELKWYNPNECSDVAGFRCWISVLGWVECPRLPAAIPARLCLHWGSLLSCTVTISPSTVLPVNTHSSHPADLPLGDAGPFMEIEFTELCHCNKNVQPGLSRHNRNVTWFVETIKTWPGLSRQSKRDLVCPGNQNVTWFVQAIKTWPGLSR